jgi:hypothetical protein
MTRVFVSYSSKDGYFTDFLVELLKYHHVDVWFDRVDLHAGDSFPTGIEEALASSDNLLAVISQHSLGSRWMTREISTFTAIHPDRLVIPLVLDADVDVDEVYEGLGLVQHLRCYESLLQSLRELMSLLGKTLFPVVERRKTTDRRSTDRRAGGDRRRSSIEQRLRIGIWKGYSELTGRGELDPLPRAHDVGRLARYLADANSPLQSFSFADRQTGAEVEPGFETLEAMAFSAWRARTQEQLTAAAYIIDDIINDLMATYVISTRERRGTERRSEEPRRGANPGG